MNWIQNVDAALVDIAAAKTDAKNRIDHLNDAIAGLELAVEALEEESEEESGL